MFYKTALALFLGIATAHAQSVPLYQSGAISSGHAGAFATNGILQDAGDANGTMPAGGVGGLSALNVRNAAGTPFCVNDNPISSSLGYHQLCLGANTTLGGVTGGFLTYNAYGPAAQLPLTFNVNGTNFPILNPTVSVLSFGAACDIVDLPDDGSITSGSAALTSSSYTFSPTAAKKNIVVMGAGGEPFYPTTVANYTINAAGTNYALNDKATMSDGTVLEITGVTGSAVNAIAIWTSSGEATLPTQPLTQSSSTGSGTGLQVTLTFYGQPLYTTIKSVSGSTATLNENAGNTVSTQRWWFGTDDSGAIQSGLNTMPSGGTLASLLVPSRCGTTKQLEMTAQTGSNSVGYAGWLAGSSRDASGLYALSPMTAVVHYPTGGGFGGGIANMGIESGALAQYGVYVESGHNFTVWNTRIQDASGSSASSDIQCGNGTTLVEEFQVLGDLSETDFNALAPAQRPLRNIQYANNCNDGSVVMTQLGAAHNQNLQFAGGTDHAATIHVFGHSPDYAASQAVVLGSSGDSAIGVQIDGSTGGSGISLGAVNTAASIIDCEGFANEYPGNVPCVNDAAGTPTQVVVSGVTTKNSGQIKIAVGGSAVLGLLSIQNPNYVFDPTFEFSGSGSLAVPSASAYAGRTITVSDGGTYGSKVYGATYAASDGSTARTVISNGSNWIYN